MLRVHIILLLNGSMAEVATAGPERGGAGEAASALPALTRAEPSGEAAASQPPLPDVVPGSQAESMASRTFELRALLRASVERVIEVFRCWDDDDSGAIDRREFRRALRALVPDVTGAECDLLFETFDADSSGSIDFRELNRQLRRVHVPAAAPAAGARPPVSAAGSPLGLLEKQYGRQVSVVQTAAEVVSRATVIFIDLPPHLAEQALRDLGGFTEAQTVVCLTPHIGLPLLHACCAPIPPAQLVRALPLPPWAEPAAAKGQAPTKRAALAAMVLDAEGQPAPLPPLLAALLAAAQRRLDRLGRLGRQLGPRHEP